MPIETLEDIIEELANSVGVYGAHDDERCAVSTCRVCWTSGIEQRIREAFDIEQKLSPLNRITRIQRLGEICGGLTGKDLELVAELARQFAERSPLTPGGCRGTKEVIVAFGQPHMMGKCPGCPDCAPAQSDDGGKSWVDCEDKA